MDNWGTEEKKKDNDITRKILIAIMILLLIIIAIIVILLFYLKQNTFKVVKDGTTVSSYSSSLLQTVGDTTYISIQDFSTIVGVEYNKGEYKEFSSDDDKCYIKSTEETASFYLNSNKVCKLKVDETDEDYEVFTFDNNVTQIDGKFYAPIDAIQVGFNVKLQLTSNRFTITTLNKLLTNVNSDVNKADSNNETTYNSLLEGEFDNQKAVLYGYVILEKKSTSLYSVITTDGQQILPDKYKNITFVESTKEFIVTNTDDKMGIVDEDGKNKVEQLYDSIKVINSDPKMYLVELNDKFGVIDEEGETIVYPEYDSIGADTTIYTKLQNQYILLDEIIPVCRDGKYGLFDIDGNKVLNVSYDGIGCELESAEINGSTKAVNPVVVIEDCNGIVIKNGESYDLFLIDDSKLISLKAGNQIYSLQENGEEEYYMALDGIELNLVERLIKAGIIKEESDISTQEENTTTNEVQNTTNGIETSNTTTNTVNINTTSTQNLAQ